MKLNKKIIAVPTIAIAAGLSLAACSSGSSGSSASGFNNPTTLAQAFTQSSRWAPGSYTPSSALCIHEQGTQFECTLTWPNGSTDTHARTVTVSSDGSTFIANGVNGQHQRL
jgi:hypothetical protein